MKTKYLKKSLTIMLAFLTPLAFSQKNIPKKQSDKLKTEAQYSVADQVIADDLIVQGSACIGFDCVNGENFGFHTIRLKENNLRIHFDDTSNSASFPNTDWELEANESANGSANSFSILDVTNSKKPFRIDANAPTNSLFVHSTGRIGLGTATPILDIHSSTGNTPGLRFEQSNSSGFTPQTWDMAGNEVNFFIRDVTNGSRLPFRIRPGAPTSSIDIGSDGNVYIKNAILPGASAPSDQRFKYNISTFSNARNTLDLLSPKSFFYDLKKFPNNDFPNGLQYGLIAQEVEQVLPDYVKEVDFPDGKSYKTVNYIGLIPVLLQSNKEQQLEIDKLKAELFKFKTLESRLATIEAKLEEQAVNVPLKTDKK